MYIRATGNISPQKTFGHQPLNVAPVEYIGNRLKSMLSKAAGKGEPAKMLYFYAHPYEYFQKNLPVPFKLMCWRSISVPFMKKYIHENLGGKKLLEAIYNKEEKEPEKCGLKGEYPMFVFNK